MANTKHLTTRHKTSRRKLLRVSKKKLKSKKLIESRIQQISHLNIKSFFHNLHIESFFYKIIELLFYISTFQSSLLVAQSVSMQRSANVPENCPEFKILETQSLETVSEISVTLYEYMRMLRAEDRVISRWLILMIIFPHSGSSLIGPQHNIW